MNAQEKLEVPKNLEDIQVLLEHQEEIDRMIEDYYKTNPDKQKQLIPILREYGKAWIYES